MNLRTSITLGLGLATVASATFVQLPAQAASSSSATSAIAFRTPSGNVAKSDNVVFSVSSPVVTKAMVGHTVSMTVNGPAKQDCRTLTLTRPGARVPARKVSCTTARAVVSFVPAKALIGTRVTLAGWSAVPGSGTVKVTGTVSVGKLVTRTSATAKRPSPKPLPPTTPAPKPKPTPTPTPKPTPTPTPTPATPKPIGPLTTLGTWNGQQVSLASAGGKNEVWVGSTRYGAIDGTVWHASLDGGVVHLWTQDSASVTVWQLDLASGNPSTHTVQGTVQYTGDPGFTLLAQPANSWPEFQQYDWSGTLAWKGAYIATSPSRPAVGFTHDYWVTKSGGQISTTIEFRDPHTGAIVDSKSPGGIYKVLQVDATGVTLELMGGDTARVEPFKPVVITPKA